MKRNTILAITTIILISLTSCGDTKSKQDAKSSTLEEVEVKKANTPEVSNASFADEMTGNVFKNYQQIRMALVNSNAEEVSNAAGNLVESFAAEREEMKAMAMAMAVTDDIEKQRALFSQFTEKVEPLFKESISEGAIYKQFCPMAFEGKGGYWISNVEEIKNPYYGDKMLKCGKVVAEIQY